MRYNEKAQILEVINEDDGAGGFTEKTRLIKTLKCKVTPYTFKVVDDAGVPVTYSRNKLLTKEKLDENILKSNFKIIYKNTVYNKILATDYGKCIVIEMEIE